MVYIRSQLTIAQEELRKAYQAGNEANTLVLQAKQNVDAATLRYQQESNIVTEATQNLEKARAEEALARLALEEAIAYYTDALPYAVIPNGNGQTNAGTPAGNNPSGSPLGPVAASNSNVNGSFTVNWTYYLSQAYGAGVNPAFPGTVTTLYPFNFGSIVSGNTVMNGNIRTTTTNQVCGGNGQVQAITGTIQSVGSQSFTMRQNNGQMTTVNVAPCTQLNANQPNYTMQSGNIAVVKGAQQNMNVLNGQSITCLA